MIAGILVAFQNLLELIAIAVLVWGAAVVVLRLAVSEWNQILGRGDRVRFEQMRVEFGQRIVLAIEFLIGADLVQSVLHPGFEELLGLGLIVLIRTVLSYFLTQEIDRHERVWKR